MLQIGVKVVAAQLPNRQLPDLKKSGADLAASLAPVLFGPRGERSLLKLSYFADKTVTKEISLLASPQYIREGISSVTPPNLKGKQKIKHYRERQRQLEGEVVTTKRKLALAMLEKESGAETPPLKRRSSQ